MLTRPNLAMSQRPLQFVTLSGVPIHVRDLRWPFHPSTSGSDWLVLHGWVDLLGGSEPLHAEVAVSLTQTIKDALGSLAEEHAEGLVINAIRKTIDNGQLAFMKSGKLQPVHVTSRFYSFATKKIQFPTQSEPDVQELILRRVFWLSSRLGGGAPVGIADPYDCQYVNFTREKMLETAQKLVSQGLIVLQHDQASVTERLLQQESAILAAMHTGVESGLAATKITA